MSEIQLYVQHVNRRVAKRDGYQEIQVGAKVLNKDEAGIEGCSVDCHVSLSIEGEYEDLPLIDVGSLIVVDLDP